MSKAGSGNLNFIVLIVAVSLLSGAAGYGAFYFSQDTSRADANAAPLSLGPGTSPAFSKHLIGTQRPAFELPDLQGKPRRIEEWDGKVVLVNFWAAWCPPCRREMPGFIELQEQYGDKGLQIVGVAIDEHQAVEDFADTLGVNYPVLIGQREASRIAREYGDSMGALPYSVLLDREGKIRFIRPGELKRETLEGQLKALL